MKVLHLLSSNNLSRAENVVGDIIMMLNDEHEMIYCSPDGSIKNSLEDREINFFPINSLSVSNIGKAVNNIKPDVIHAHDVTATIYAAFFSKKIPLISHLHGNADNMKK